MLAAGHEPSGSLQALRHKRRDRCHAGRCSRSFAPVFAVSSLWRISPVCDLQRVELRASKCWCYKANPQQCAPSTISLTHPNPSPPTPSATHTTQPRLSHPSTTPQPPPPSSPPPHHPPPPIPAPAPNAPTSSVPAAMPPSPSSATTALATAADAEAARRGLASMAQLMSAWAQVSSRLSTPGTSLASTDGMMEGTAVAGDGYPLLPSESGAGGAEDGRVEAGEQQAYYQLGETGEQRGRHATVLSSREQMERGAAAQAQPLLPNPATQRSLPLLPAQTGAAYSDTPTTLQENQNQAHSLPGPPYPQSQHPHEALAPQHTPSPQHFRPHHQHQQHHHQQHQQQQQQQHFEAIITALKLALASLQSAPPRRDGRTPATRAVQLAATLADLCAAGLPLDAVAMCAGVVAEAADLGVLSHEVIRAQLGAGVAALVHDMLRVRRAPQRIDVLDDEGASAAREWVLACHDVRACAVEVVGWWDELQHMGRLPTAEQQAMAMEALQVGAPLGHTLGLGPLSALMEDSCLRVLFPGSYASTAAWLRGLLLPADSALAAAQQQLQAALAAHSEFGRLAGGVVVKSRTKSLFSVMKKLLHLGDMARGGRSREELYDLLGMRVIVQPPAHLPPEEAEAAATRACYVVQEVASSMWRSIPSRSKDYIAAPKRNGYQSIHLTLQLDSNESPHQPVSNVSSDFGDADDDGPMGQSEPLYLELQIRTAAMDGAAESGDAAHAVYKGGMDARTARQLQAWTQELRSRLATQSRGQLLLRAASMKAPSGSRRSLADMSPEEAAAAAERRRRRRERRAAAAAAAESGAAAEVAIVSDVVAAAGVEADRSAGALTGADDAEGDLPMPTLLPPPRRPAGSLPASAPPSPPPQPPTAARPYHLRPSSKQLLKGRYRMHASSASPGLQTTPDSAAVALSETDGSLQALREQQQHQREVGSSNPTPSGGQELATEAPGANPDSPGEAAGAERMPDDSTPAFLGAGVGTVPGLQPSPANAADSAFVPSPHAPGSVPPPAAPATAPLLPNREHSSLILPSTPRAQQPHRQQQEVPRGQLSPQPPPQTEPQAQQQQQVQQQVQQPDRQQQQSLQQREQLLLFSSLGSIDEMEEALVIGMPPRDAAAAAEQLFRHLDVNGDGRLSLGEVQQVLLDLAAPASDRDAAALVAALDSNGDGGVSLEEFVEGVRLAQLQQEQQQEQQHGQ